MGTRPAARGGGGDAVERAPLLTLLEAELAAAEAFAPRSAPALLSRRTLKARRRRYRPPPRCDGTVARSAHRAIGLRLGNGASQPSS